MIEASFGALLVALVGLAALPQAGLPLAGGSAIALTAITGSAEVEEGVTVRALADAQPQRDLAGFRHLRPRGLDNGSNLVAP